MTTSLPPAGMRLDQSLFVSTPFFQMSRIRILLSALLAAFLLPGCGRDNGMPRDLIDHLKAHGVAIQPSRIEAPLSQRGGFLVTKYDASAVAKIISEFGLQKIALADPRWVFVAQKIGSTVAAKEVWGVSGRPPQFKLSNGGQFEYFYLLVTPDGEVYLFAEYAFG